MNKLNSASLSGLPARLSVPGYDRSELSVGIVHFGVGGFHRAHQAMYVDRLMNDGGARDWAICGVGVLPGDSAMKTVMDAQDCLYTLVLKNPDGTREGRVIGSIIEYLLAPEDPEAVIEKMAAPGTRIVSLTITEGGYNFHHVTGEFNAANPAVAEDLQPDAVPTTVFGLVCAALQRRRDRGLPPFTVMSCDNIQGNGDVARKMFTAFASLRDPELGAWMQENVAFPNSMVDRITPVTTDEDRTMVARDFEVEDAWPVVSEDFEQWVLEDHFPQGRPPFEDAGVQVVDDVEPYELMKLRLLNASHQALCYFGYLAGYRYAHEVCQDPLFSGFLLDYMVREATPTLAPLPGVDLDAYRHRLIERFSNEHVRDTLARLCAESSDRIPKWLLPVIRENLASGGEIHRSAAIVASWSRYAEGTDEQGAPIEVVDRLREPLMAAAARNRADPLAFVEDRDLFGDLASNDRFVQSYTAALASLHEHGARTTLEDLAAGRPT
ncbi:mannitol dehydrogenase family protein [Arthrobacter sunyaminii]|uniref:Mannitol-1-phosphate 5-dehydrogenase n=1 Tax=Arthrobacter sunyaminii TaxID=2816859 RepID=A0A975S5R7_9MICC|nr:mannitol dehydrogenase family protein [Arthrobacter sunyaminii]MBO0909573.1 mannitol dehydrogenase family protein [Arthrobacter sunyaminii]QWQ36119.1 mannitol dehydrogenase family protein [Arthrobacter sunyaminii]